MRSIKTHDHENDSVSYPPDGSNNPDADDTASDGVDSGQSKSESGFDLPFKIVLVVAHMGLGGSQRVMSILANNWASQGHQIELITLYDRPVQFPLHQDIRFTCLEKPVRRRWDRWLKPSTYMLLVGRIILFPFVLFRQNHDPARAVNTGYKFIISRLKAAFGLVNRAERVIWNRLNRSLQLIRHRIRLLLVFMFGRHAAGIIISMLRILHDISRIRELRRHVKDSEASTVLAFIGKTNIVTILACIGTEKRVVISERNDPALQSLGPDMNFLRERIYRHADVVTANSHGALRTMKRYVPASKLVYVPNPLHIPTTVRSAAQRDKVILTVARLHHQKGIDILLEAYRIVLDNCRDWRLCIVGDGEERQALQQQATRLDIATMIDWQGQVADVSPFFASSGLFVLPSRHEGTPNALLEAMAYSMPVVVTNSSPGPVAAIGQAGCVVAGGNPAAIAETVLDLIKDDTRRQKLGKAARALCHKYSLERVEDRWNAILGLTGKPDTRIQAGANTNG